jgi:hypothetical protein
LEWASRYVADEVADLLNQDTRDHLVHRETARVS